jgi:hypothetical protein
MGSSNSSASSKSETISSPMESKRDPIDQCPHFQSSSTATEATTYPSECPMSGADKNDINPLNMMPPPNQMPSPDQPFSLSTDRVVSSIPKVAEKDENWVSIRWLSPVSLLKSFLGLSISTNVLECDVTQRLALARQCFIIEGYGEYCPNA